MSGDKKDDLPKNTGSRWRTDAGNPVRGPRFIEADRGTRAAPRRPEVPPELQGVDYLLTIVVQNGILASVELSKSVKDGLTVGIGNMRSELELLSEEDPHGAKEIALEILDISDPPATPKQLKPFARQKLLPRLHDLGFDDDSIGRLKARPLPAEEPVHADAVVRALQAGRGAGGMPGPGG